jgi:putative holliday junction resolvase
MRYLGVDPGEKRVGLAVSDPEGKMAMPLGVIDEADGAAQVEQIIETARLNEADSIVVGMPYTLRGEIGPTAQRVVEQIELLRQRTQLPVHTHDERFSSGIAEHVLLEADVSRAGRKRHRDKLAATVMLQSFLDRQSAEEPAEPQ